MFGTLFVLQCPVDLEVGVGAVGHGDLPAVRPSPPGEAVTHDGDRHTGHVHEAHRRAVTDVQVHHGIRYGVHQDPSPSSTYAGADMNGVRQKRQVQTAGGSLVLYIALQRGQFQV